MQITRYCAASFLLKRSPNASPLYCYLDLSVSWDQDTGMIRSIRKYLEPHFHFLMEQTVEEISLCRAVSKAADVAFVILVFASADIAGITKCLSIS